MNFGLIGRNLSHSFSEQYFREKFKQEKISSNYRTFELEQIEQLPELIHNQNLQGFNVTIPYKEQVISYLHGIEEEAKIIGAVNCVSVQNQQLMGYNTDAFGFQKTLIPLLKPHHARALIFGNGGAAKAVKFVLHQLQIPFTLISRNGDTPFSEVTEEKVKSHNIIINTTPVGTFPHTNDTLPFPVSAIGNDHLVYDLIYNPEKTQLLQMAEKNGATIKNGYEMLVQQAEESWRIWNG